ncbi:DNA mismatch repair ATPase msh1, partial [Nowakowskiella sp. JEL0078]
MFKEIELLRNNFSDSILLVQVGSFYELYDSPYFSEVAELLGLKVVARKYRNSSQFRIAGFPCSQLKKFAECLTNNGYSVAIADQVARDEISRTKRLQRAVVRVISAGTDLELEDLPENRFLLALNFSNQKIDYLIDSMAKVGLAWVDISTGEFNTTETTLRELNSTLARVKPVEIILDEQLRASKFANWVEEIASRALITFKASEYFEKESAKSLVEKIFAKNSISFSDNLESRLGAMLVGACAALVRYVSHSFPGIEPYFLEPTLFNSERFMRMDMPTLCALSLGSSTSGSLFAFLNCTKTKMGHRLLASRIRAPSLQTDEISAKLDLVEIFFNNSYHSQLIQNLLLGVEDIERMVQKLNLGQGGPFEFIRILESLNTISIVKTHVQELITSKSQLIDQEIRQLDILKDLSDRITDLSSISIKFKDLFTKEARNNKSTQIGSVKEGFSDQLDKIRTEYRILLNNAEKLRLWIAYEYKKEANCEVEVKFDYDGKDGAFIEVSGGKGVLMSNLKKKIESQVGVRLLAKQRAEKKIRIARNDWTELKEMLLKIEDNLQQMEFRIFRDACDE